MPRFLATRHAAIVALATATAFSLHAPARSSTPTASALSTTARTAAAAIPAAYGEAARLARSGDWAGAERRLAPLADSKTGERERARIVLGLLAWSDSRFADASARLAAGPGPLDLEDWRLYALGDSLANADKTSAAARTAFETLVARSLPSPLVNLAVARLAELAWAAGDAPAALGWVARGRGRTVDRTEAARLDTLAWQIGRARGDAAVEVEAARRLLVGAPLEASKLEVAAPLTARGVDWRGLLTADELIRRSAALLEAGIPAGALTTLEAVPTAARRIEWRLLEASALVESNRGAEALSRLAGVVGSTPDENARIELARARAAGEAATVRSGRPHPVAEERDRLRTFARAAFARAAELASDPALKERALRAQYAELESEDRFEEAIVVLRQLVQLDPGVTLGARGLWERGWNAYRGGNFSGAIGFWTELTALYPAQSHARSAAYWSARSHEALGESERARDGYRDIVSADTRDFYARQAEIRLAGARGGVATPPPPAVREIWPEDAALGRARLLSDLGLDRIATLEIEKLAGVSDPRAAAALKGLTLARSGDARTSLRELRKAFPRLGSAHQQTVPREALELYYPRPFDDRVVRFAKAQALPASLVFGIVHQESGFDAAAVSRSGARGLMQIMPATGRELATRLKMTYTTQRLLEPDYSLQLGTTYFRQLMGQFDGRVELALASYNGGPGRIGRLWRAHGNPQGVDLFLEDLALEESRNYVKRILVLAESYRSLYSDLG